MREAKLERNTNETQIELEIEHVKAILSQDDEGQELESYLERSREIRGKLPYLTGQIKDN